jgi:hypothetical protein
MKTKLAAAILVLAASRASAHRLDEYLQATLISVEKDRIQAEIRLTPGVAVFPNVLRTIDTDSDGVISEREARAYAERVLDDLSLTVEGRRLPLRLVSFKIPEIQDMKEGLGAIQIEFTADVAGNSLHRKLIFENRHQGGIGAYLVNCLVPSDPVIRIIAQKRNYQQSFYELNYEQACAARTAGTALVGIIALALLARLAMLWRPNRILRKWLANPLPHGRGSVSRSKRVSAIQCQEAVLRRLCWGSRRQSQSAKPANRKCSKRGPPERGSTWQMPPSRSPECTRARRREQPIGSEGGKHDVPAR